MKLRRLARYHGLSRPRLRQTWNKYNLFNIFETGRSKFKDFRSAKSTQTTFFQQKWYAKAHARAYHGEHIKERHWERMFSRRLPSVVNMEPRYMASQDGSMFARGRGSGLDKELAPTPMLKPRKIGQTPHMQMAFYPLERRLDTAIFRAMFASSVRQARQMVIHGAVMVNGKKLTHPSYLLNPGDMFQVDPERVMTATGRQRPVQAKEFAARKPRAPRSTEGEETAVAEAEAEPAAEEPTPAEPAAEAEPQDEEAAKAATVTAMREIRERAKDVIRTHKKELSGNRKKALRTLMKEARASISKGQKSETALDEAKDILTRLSESLSQLDLDPKASPKEGEKDPNAEPEVHLSKGDLALIRKEINAQLENPYDPSKPYLTPWLPRPYMSAFAFIPRYLEVNQKICAAVYLRHPVARRGEAEVPTPFPEHLNQLAFNWYLRRG